jgi:hypothetical protein
MKTANVSYLEKAQKLDIEEQERVLSRMAGKLPKRLQKEKLTKQEAIAIQLELEDEQLQEWRSIMAELKAKSQKAQIKAAEKAAAQQEKLAKKLAAEQAKAAKKAAAEQLKMAKKNDAKKPAAKKVDVTKVSSKPAIVKPAVANDVVKKTTN